MSCGGSYVGYIEAPYLQHFDPFSILSYFHLNNMNYSIDSMTILTANWKPGFDIIERTSEEDGLPKAKSMLSGRNCVCKKTVFAGTKCPQHILLSCCYSVHEKLETNALLEARSNSKTLSSSYEIQQVNSFEKGNHVKSPSVVMQSATLLPLFQAAFSMTSHVPE